MLLATGFLACAHGASATTIIEDTFSRVGPLAGTATEVGNVPYYEMQGFENYSTDGSRLNVTGVHWTAGVPFSVPLGVIIRASVDLQLATPGDGQALALSFRSNHLSEVYYNSGPWVERNGRGEVVAMANGVDEGAPVFSNGLTVVPGAVTRLELFLDTRLPQWTTTLYVNGIFDGSYTYATNPTISYVSVGHDLGVGWFDNLKVDTVANVPEPTSLGLCGFLSLGALGRRRSRRA